MIILRLAPVAVGVVLVIDLALAVLLLQALFHGLAGLAVALAHAGGAVLLVSLELDEVMNVSDRILVMYEGEIVGELDPKQTTVEELGLYMAGAKREGKKA